MSSADATSTPEKDEVDNSNNETPRKFFASSKSQKENSYPMLGISRHHHQKD